MNLNPQAEQAIEAAATLVGTPEARKIMRFLYTMGYMDGALEIANVSATRARDLLAEES